MNLSGWFWDAVASLNNNFGTLGFIIIGIFIASWMISILFYRLNRYDEIEVNLGESS
jgi:high-affinity nickel-transport protein